MSTLNTAKQATRHYPHEDEAYWTDIYSRVKSSGGSRKAYCKTHDINYDRLGYWLSRQRQRKPTKLIAVKVAHSSSSDTRVVIASVRWSPTQELVFHDVESLCAVMKRLS